MKKVLTFVVVLFLGSLLMYSQISIFIQGGKGFLSEISEFSYLKKWSIEDLFLKEEGGIKSNLENALPFAVGIEKTIGSGFSISFSFMYVKHSFTSVSKYTLTLTVPKVLEKSYPEGDESTSCVTVKSINLGIVKEIRFTKTIGMDVLGGLSYYTLENDYNGMVGFAGIFKVRETPYFDYFVIPIYDDTKISKFGGYGGIRLFYRMGYNLSLYLFSNYFYIPKISFSIKPVLDEYTGKMGGIILPINDENWFEKSKEFHEIEMNMAFLSAGAGIKIYF